MIGAFLFVKWHSFFLADTGHFAIAKISGTLDFKPEIMEAILNKAEQTSNNKIIFPATGITKQQVVQYYDNIAEHILPYLKDRPLTMQRFPGGVAKEGFFQKDAPEGFPDWVSTVEVNKEGERTKHIVCNSKDILLYLVNQNVLTFHVALSKTEKMEYPDKLIFDLDPPEGNFALVVKAAKALRKLLEEKLDLKSYVMASGSNGLHVIVPLKQEDHFEKVRDFAKEVADYVCSKNPDEFTTGIQMYRRQGRLYIDTLRNYDVQTSVAPFSLRVKEKAPVATPLSWDELDEPSLNAQTYTIHSIFERLKSKSNPWVDFDQNAQSIGGAIKKMQTLTN